MNDLWLYHLESPAVPVQMPDCWQLCIPISGWGHVQAEGHRSHTLGVSRMLLLAPGDPVTLEFDSGSQWYQLIVAPGALVHLKMQPLQQPGDPPILLHIDHEQQSRLHILLAMLAAEESHQLSDSPRAIYLLVGLILLEIDRAKNRPRRQNSGQDGLIPRVLDYLDEHYADPITLEGLAERFFVSKYYLSHAFSQAAGIPLYKYLLQTRLNAARQLLIQGMPPTQVCQHCGFGDYTNFYRAFKKHFGCSPQSLAQDGSQNK